MKELRVRNVSRKKRTVLCVRERVVEQRFHWKKLSTKTRILKTQEPQRQQAAHVKNQMLCAAAKTSDRASRCRLAAAAGGAARTQSGLGTALYVNWASN